MIAKKRASGKEVRVMGEKGEWGLSELLHDMNQRIFALEKEIAELKVQISERPVSKGLVEKVAREIAKGLESSSISHTL